MKTLFTKLSILAATVILLEVPVVSLTGIIILSFSILYIVFNDLHLNKQKLILALAVFLVATITINLLPELKIKQQHNVFIINDGKTNAFKQSLPQDTYSVLRQLFYTNYKNIDCDAQKYPTCWKNTSIATTLYEKSLDGDYVSGINFTSRAMARLGAINKTKYNIMTPPYNNIIRDRIPFFISYEFPSEAVGMELSWTGDMLFADGLSTTGVRVLTKADISKPIIYSGIKDSTDVAVRLNQSWQYKLSLAIKTLVQLLAVSGILFLLFKIPNSKYILGMAVLLALQSLYILLYKPEMLSGLPVLVGGGDGLVFYNNGRDIALNILSGNFMEALRGGSDSFYYMPGLRYLIAINNLIFGESLAGYAVFVAFIPIIVFNLLRKIFNNKTALIMLALFFIPPMKFFGFASHFYIKMALTAYGEAISYGLFILVLGWFIKYKNSANDKYVLYGFWGCFFLAVSIFVRPNMGIVAGLLILWYIKDKLFTDFKTVVLCSLGFTPVFFTLWHNLYFAGEFAFFTTSKSFNINFMLTPFTYLVAFKDLIVGNFSSTEFVTIKEHLHNWNRLTYFFRWPLLVLPIIALFSKQVREEVKLLAIMGIAMQGQLLFFNPKLRYATLAWMLCFLASLCYLIRGSEKVSVK